MQLRIKRAAHVFRLHGKYARPIGFVSIDSREPGASERQRGLAADRLQVDHVGSSRQPSDTAAPMSRASAACAAARGRSCPARQQRVAERQHAGVERILSERLVVTQVAEHGQRRRAGSPSPSAALRSAKSRLPSIVSRAGMRAAGRDRARARRRTCVRRSWFRRWLKVSSGATLGSICKTLFRTAELQSSKLSVTNPAESGTDRKAWGRGSAEVPTRVEAWDPSKR